MRYRLIPLSIFVTFLFSTIYSCNSDPKSKLLGTWKAENVEIDFDEQVASPELIRQVGLENKELSFKFTSDTTMVLYISAASDPQNLFWTLDANGSTIYYSYKKDDLDTVELGKLIEGKIVAESTTPLGSIKTTFVKE